MISICGFKIVFGSLVLRRNFPLRYQGFIEPQLGLAVVLLVIPKTGAYAHGVLAGSNVKRNAQRLAVRDILPFETLLAKRLAIQRDNPFGDQRSRLKILLQCDRCESENFTLVVESIAHIIGHKTDLFGRLEIHPQDIPDCVVVLELI